MQANIGNACLRTSAFFSRTLCEHAEWYDAQRPAMIGEITAPVRRSSGNVVTFDRGVGLISVLCRDGATKAASRE
jgi:hypothetical protein